MLNRTKRSKGVDFGEHLPLTVLVAGLVASHRSLMEGQIGRAIAILAAAGAGAVILAAAARLVRYLQ
ncbi:MAG TPA: hypothetical protein VM733_07455 [Thermoanaerobaculia bacterium]|nr:hypothetical protein [Thermoanaerobaculia bacterium]